MRYTCFRTIVRKVYDGILDDPEEIKNLLTQLKIKEITCSLKTKSGPCHEYVRILEVGESVTWRIIKNNTSLKKVSNIDDISSIEVCTSDEVMLNLKPEPSRWSTIDTSDI
jgi:hypothetical protein